MGCKTPNIRIARYYFDGSSSTQRFIPHQKVESYEYYRNFNDEMQKLYNSDPIQFDDIRAQLIPCGHCLACQMTKAREWAIRCMAEAKEYENNYFITLTYDEEHLPHDYSDDQWNILGTLKIKDTQDFMKRLRRHFEYEYGHQGIKFFLCGEYGPTTGRPHYHAIIFNCPLDPEKFRPIIGRKDIWTSEELEKIWGKGMVSIGEVTSESAAYVARYVTKKHYGADAKQYYEDECKVPEFINMSRREGIGLKYFTEHYKEIYENDEMIYKGKKIAFKVKPVKYYDKKFDLIEPEQMAAIKEERLRAATEAHKVKMSKTTLTEKEQLLGELDALEERLKKGAGYARTAI